MFTVVPEEEKRVIDSNGLMEQRIAEWEEKQRAGGFVPGLNAAQVEVLPEEEVETDPAVLLEKANEEAQQILEQAAVDAQSRIADAQVEAMKIKKEAQVQAEIEKGQILEQASRQGYEEGYARAQEEVEAVRLEYEEKERQMEAFYQQQIDELEPRFIDAITDVYEHIFGVGLKDQRDIIAHLISNTIRKIEGGHSFIIHVSKEDYPFVSMQKKQLVSGAGAANATVEVVEDLAMAAGDCTIETDGGIFDCGLGTQLSELRQKLMLLAYSREA